MAKIVLICGHPSYKESVANKAIVEEFHKLVPGADIAVLSELYPDFQIDAKKEQQRLTPADMVIFQYPFWWYGAPSLMHRYIEQVFLHGWAYGSAGKALNGKSLVLSFTTGAPEADYQVNGGVGHTLEQFLTGMMTTAAFTGMIYRGAVYCYNMANYDPSDANRIKVIQQAGKEGAKKLKAHISQFIQVE